MREGETEGGRETFQVFSIALQIKFKLIIGACKICFPLVSDNLSGYSEQKYVVSTCSAPAHGHCQVPPRDVHFHACDLGICSC